MDVERLFEDRVVCFVLGRLSVFFDLRGGAALIVKTEAENH